MAVAQLSPAFRGLCEKKGRFWPISRLISGVPHSVLACLTPSKSAFGHIVPAYNHDPRPEQPEKRAGKTAPGGGFPDFSTRLTEELSTAYTSLQAQVAVLTEELAAAKRRPASASIWRRLRTEACRSSWPHCRRASWCSMRRQCGGSPIQPPMPILGAGLVTQSWEQVERNRLAANDTPGEYLAGEKRRVASR